MVKLYTYTTWHSIPNCFKSPLSMTWARLRGRVKEREQEGKMLSKQTPRKSRFYNRAPIFVCVCFCLSCIPYFPRIQTFMHKKILFHVNGIINCHLIWTQAVSVFLKVCCIHQHFLFSVLLMLLLLAYSGIIPHYSRLSPIRIVWNNRFYVFKLEEARMNRWIGKRVRERESEAFEIYVDLILVTIYSNLWVWFAYCCCCCCYWLLILADFVLFYTNLFPFHLYPLFNFEWVSWMII